MIMWALFKKVGNDFYRILQLKYFENVERFLQVQTKAILISFINTYEKNVSNVSPMEEEKSTWV